MKPEPLKRSFMGKAIHPHFTKEDECVYCLKEDIKSAVEWLRKRGKCFDKISKKELSWKIVEDRMKVGLKNTIWFVVDYNNLTKAFEGVMK